MPIRLILIGPPGVGKGTQAALIEERLGVRTLSSGVIFRAEIEAETDLGQLAKSYIDRGELVPNGVTIQMMLKRIRSDEARKKGFVLDGFPRTIRQAEALELELAQAEMPIQRVISLEVSEDVLIRRLSGRMGCTKCGALYHRINKPPKRDGLCDVCNSPLFVRADDQPDTIRQRLVVFNEQTSPLVQFYEERGTLRHVDATHEAEEVYREIVEGLS